MTTVSTIQEESLKGNIPLQRFSTIRRLKMWTRQVILILGSSVDLGNEEKVKKNENIDSAHSVSDLRSLWEAISRK